jgi:SulP family sulfate permease
MVIVIVIGVAVSVGLIMASGVGIGLAIILFIREQIRGSVIHRRISGKQMSSRQRRLPDQMAILERRGEEILICELEGNLFFGTTDQLYTELEKDLATRRFIIMDMRRVRGVDFTAVHVLKQIETRLQQRGARLLFSNLPRVLPSGGDLRSYFNEVGLVTAKTQSKVFKQLSDALEWTEDQILQGEGLHGGVTGPLLDLGDFTFAQGRKADTIAELESCLVARRYAPGEVIFRHGEAGDAIYFIRRGSVRIELILPEGGDFHIATFGRGDFFGDMAFIDHKARSADAVAETQTELFELSRERFDAVADRHPRLAMEFFVALARTLAIRLRHADGEIRALEET